ncbi:hypothetical protein, partial [Acetobacter papayae]|uniref:hypothetical protein n=1 Tax=Acetobacter papayae TaxID=1076592 RepID=UPI001F393D27
SRVEPQAGESQGGVSGPAGLKNAGPEPIWAGARFCFTPPASLSGGGLYGCLSGDEGYNICPWP